MFVAEPIWLLFIEAEPAERLIPVNPDEVVIRLKLAMVLLLIAVDTQAPTFKEIPVNISNALLVNATPPSSAALPLI